MAHIQAMVEVCYYFSMKLSFQKLSVHRMSQYFLGTRCMAESRELTLGGLSLKTPTWRNEETWTERSWSGDIKCPGNEEEDVSDHLEMHLFEPK